MEPSSRAWQVVPFLLPGIDEDGFDIKSEDAHMVLLSLIDMFGPAIRKLKCSDRLGVCSQLIMFLEEEQASFRAWITSLGAVPAITKLQTKAEDLRQAELKRADKKLQSLSSREIEAVERLSRGIVSKLLHGPMSSLRGEGSTDDKKNTLSALKKMFGV